VAIARKKSTRGKRLKDTEELPMALQLYFKVLLGTRPLDVLDEICAPDVIFQHDKHDRVVGIEAVHELIAFRRNHLAGPPVGIKRMVDNGESKFGHCVKVDFTLRTRAVSGKLSTGKPGEPLFLFLIGMYYLGKDGRITDIYEAHWPELFRLTRVAS
jgi:hypothetical protein